MIINADKKFIFVHVPKVAGTSVTDALGGSIGIFWATNPSGDQNLVASHTYASEIRQFLGDAYNDYFTFSFVRNPWDRLYSLYNFMTYSKEISRLGNVFDQELSKEKGFKWFLLENRLYTTRAKMYGTNLNICAQTTPQTSWISHKGSIIVDFVGTYENLHSDFSLVCRKLGYETPLPWKNKHTADDYIKAYDNEMIDFVSKHHASDINLFEYTFDNR